jgi:peptidoglycan/LPS O-acetylase OafA/YrhL
VAIITPFESTANETSTPAGDSVAHRRQPLLSARFKTLARLMDLGPAQPKPGFYPGLDLLRGFAAVSVVVYHSIAHFNWTTFPNDNIACLWLRMGWMGVDLFFVISGFVIALSAWNLIERDPTGYARAYCKRRLARIVPLHYVTCLFWVLFIMPAVIFDPKFLWHALSHLTFTHNWAHKTAGSINGPNWSLGVEMQFYILILIATPWLRRMRPLSVLGVALAVAWAWRAAAFALYHGQLRDGVNMTWLGISQVPGMLDEFACGIALALFLHRDSAGRRARFLHATRWFWPIATWLVATVTMRLFWLDSDYWGNWKLVTFWRSLLALTFLLAVISACALNDRWILAITAPFRYLGTISYGIYLWHSLVIYAIRPLVADNPFHACLWVLGLTLLLSSTSWHFFEKPLMEQYGRGGSKGGGEGRRDQTSPLTRPDVAHENALHPYH